EIQDEFDAEELSVVRIADGKWKISGLTPVHDLPEELGLDDHDEELATFGGLITRELGKIPKRNETIRFPSFDAKVLNADETRVLEAEVSLLPSPKSE
ncbi:MAG: transporter associated domain-containing protein, partial [Verrucomicrobiota bacterium]